MATLPLLATLLLSLPPSAAGVSQSPIDITSNGSVFAALPALAPTYGTSVNLDLVNTGSPGENFTVRANVPGGAGSVQVNSVSYDLLQFHFHTEAEHLVNGHQAAMELHFVHQSAGGVLLVIGEFIEIGAFNVLLDPIFSHLPQNSGDHAAVNSFNLAALLPTSLLSYRYDGSLTTPPFTEGVLWNVLVGPPIEMSQAQVDAFRALFPDGNARDVQDISGRIVQTDDALFPSPEPASMLLFSFGGALLIWRKRQITRR